MGIKAEKMVNKYLYCILFIFTSLLFTSSVVIINAYMQLNKVLFYSLLSLFVVVFLISIGYYILLITKINQERTKARYRGKSLRRFQYYVPFTGDYQKTEEILVKYLTKRKFKLIYYGDEPVFYLEKKVTTYHEYVMFIRCADGYLLQAFVKPFSVNPRVTSYRVESLYGHNGFFKKMHLRGIVNDLYYLIKSEELNL